MTETKKPLKWTARGIEALTVADRTDFTDPDTKGLVLRVTPTGSKTWSVLYRRKGDSKKRRVWIGEFPGVGLSQAREEAAKIRVQVNLRQDPANEAAAIKKADTVGELLDLFIEQHPRPDAAWTKECARLFNKDVRPLIGAVKLPDLARSHVRQVIEAVKARGATTTVNRTHAALRKAFSWAVKEDRLPLNPALNLATNIEEKTKSRALAVDEIAQFWRGLDAAPMGPKLRNALRLVLITGQRPGEVAGARKAEIDLAASTWLIPNTRTKNKQPHLVPLSPLAKAIFTAAISEAGDGEFVFPTRPRHGKGLARTVALKTDALSHAMNGALEKLGLSANPASPHDLRRTVATHMARLGVPESHVGRVLNHRTEARRTITSKVYITHDFLPEKKQALDTWAAELQRLIADREDAPNVVELRAQG